MLQWTPPIVFKNNLQSLNTIKDNIKKVKLISQSAGIHDGLADLISITTLNGFQDPEEHKLNSLSKFALPKILLLIEGIVQGNLPTIKNISKSLMGLGIGLTPSGDDMLAGLMISLFFFDENFDIPTIDVRKINENIISHISGKTTKISEEYLKEASVGNANESLHSLIKNILISTPNELLLSVKSILELGSTSGVDTILGIILGSNLMLSEIFSGNP